MMVSPIATSTSNAPSVSPLNNWAQSKGQFIGSPRKISRSPPSEGWQIAADRIAGWHHIRAGREAHNTVKVFRIAHFARPLADHDWNRAHLLVIAFAEVNLTKGHLQLVFGFERLDHRDRIEGLCALHRVGP